MTATGFLEQKNASPLSFGMVLALHGAAIAAVLLVKGPGWVAAPDVRTVAYEVEAVPPPPENPPPRPEPQVQQAPSVSRLDVPKQIVEPPIRNLPVVGQSLTTPPGPVVGNDPAPGGGTQQLTNIPPREPIRTPVRVEAQVDPRFAGALQPPYPPSEIRREREGTVRIRVTIGPNGRVVAAERVSAPSDAFWEATERQALSRWRFRPATVDGRPVQSTKVLTVHFRLDG